MHQFSKIEIAWIDRSIRLGIGRAMRQHRSLAVDADDIAQDAWLKICMGFDATKQAASAAVGFAYRVAYRVALDHARGAYRRGAAITGSIDATIGEDDASLHELIADANADFVPKMQDAAVERDFWSAVAVANLSDSEKHAMHVDQAGERALTNAERQSKFKAMKKIKAVLAQQV